MSDTDDRMDRAERIRRMRESREPGDDNETADAADGNDVDSDAVAGDAAVTNGDSGTADDAKVIDDAAAAAEQAANVHDDPAENSASAIADGVERDESGMDDAMDRDDSTSNAMERAGSSEESDAPQALMTGSGADEQPNTEGTAQAARTDTDPVGAQPATTDGTEMPPDAVNQAASTAGDGETATSEAIAPLGGSSGFSLPGAEELEAATDSAETEVVDEGMTAGAARSRGTAATATEPSVRVLEFTVGYQVYCIDIEEVEEIVKRESVTRVPNTEAYVEGVVDLRGQITTILDTKQLLDVDEDGLESLLVIFAPDAFEEHGTVGWVVDEVRQVAPVMESQVRTAPSEEEYVRGVVDRDDEDELIVWIRPGDAMASAVAVEDDD